MNVNVNDMNKGLMVYYNFIIDIEYWMFLL